MIAAWPARLVAAAAGIALLACAAAAASGVEFRLEERASLADIPANEFKPETIAFSDHRSDKITDPKTGLIRFADWAKARPLQKQLLSPYPGYEEPTITTTVGGVAKTVKRLLHVYVAEARFEIARPPAAIDLGHYVSLAILNRMDPAIKHTPISANDVAPNKNARLANRNPDRRWCEGAGAVICIKSRYQLEGKLPSAISLLNKLRESGKQIADFIEFESELRVVPPASIDQSAFAKLTGIDAPVAAALEQNIVQVNQVMQFGKFLAVLQPKPSDPGVTIVTTFVALAVESDLFEKRKDFENIPVLRNIVPAQILAGNSSFNTGTSISAGLPIYSRNRIKAMAAILSRE